MSQAVAPERYRNIAVNRRARFEYHIEEVFEAGLVLTGTEVKSLRAGRANLTDAYASIEGGEVWLHGLHISPWDKGGYVNHEPLRPRKLLLHRHQIRRLIGKVGEKGLTLIPLRLYFKEGRAKVELGLARGKKLYDKREAIAQREARREIERATRQAFKGRGD
jgi:SsrA-binding protein